MTPNDDEVRTGPATRPRANGADEAKPSFDETRMMRPTLDLDELEALEAERDAKAGFWAKTKRILVPATREDMRIYRTLFRYVRPYWYKVVAAIFLSILTGGLIVGQLALIQEGLTVMGGEAEPGSSAVTPFEKVKRMLGRDTPTTPAPDPTQTPDPDPAAPAGPTVVAPPAGGPAAPPPPSKEDRRTSLFQVVILFFCVILVGSLLKYIQSMLMASTTRKVIRRLREDTFKNLVRLPLRFHQSTHSGKIVARVTKDINRLREMMIGFAITGSKELCIFIGALWFAIHQTSWAALFAVGFVVLAILPIRIIADKIRHRSKAAEAGSGDMFAILSEALSGQKVVKTFSGEGYEIKRFKHATRSIYKKQMATYRLRAMTEPVVDIVGGIGIAAAIWFLGGAVIEGDLTVPILATLLVALQKLNGSVRKLGKLQNDFVRGIACGGRVVRILDQTPEIKEHPDAVPLDRLERAIEFRGVRFQYQEDVPVLRGVDLTVRKGETVAIVGPSGSGKTSLVDLLPRLYDIDDGAITIDGIDIRDLTLKSLRRQIGTVTQETILFRDTIRENIAYGLDDVSDEAIEAAAKAANAHHFIVDKPNGYDTEMGERGLRLSGGERQRIAIARALLKNPPILILDEATSALDAEAEASVQSALDHLMKGRTTLVIAHRLATIRRADRIVVLVKGEIHEEGTHEELMAKDGRYARAFRMQTEALSRGESEGPIDQFFSDPSA